MEIMTRDFGAMDIDRNSILKFELPILGFEKYRDFVILYDKETGDELAWLQSVDKSDVCFIMIEPSRFISGYAPALPADALEKLELSAENAVLRCLMVVRNDIEDSTINLKSPIIINPEKKLAGQVILDEELPVRARIG